MKQKILLFLVGILLLFPISIQAMEPTDKFYMDITILENGDIKVKELAKLSGSYNGRIRTIKFMNTSAPHFTGKESDFEGSDIYNGSSISVDKVADVEITGDFSFDSMNQLNHTYNRITSSSTSTYQSYEEEDNYDGVYLKIYNPSRTNTAFYIEYTIKDAVVVHEDVAELAWNILGDEYEENIGTLEARVHLPGDDADYRVWLKGPLNGEVERTTEDMATATYNFLGAYNAVTIRMMFNKDLVPNATKYSHVKGREHILAVEQKAADKSNKEREKIRLQNHIFWITFLGWTTLLVISLVYFFYQRKKNRKSNFNQDYFRDFPASYGPEVLEYLLNKSVGEASLSACILSLVDKKVLEVEEVGSDKKKDYIFKWNKQEEGLSDTEKEVISLFIKEVGDGESVSLEVFKKYGNSYSHASSFMSSYRSFIKKGTEAGKKEAFFQKAPSSIIFVSILLGLGLFVAQFALVFGFVFIGIATIFVSIVILIIILSTKFYSEKGREDLAKWKALKHFLEDFSTFDEKELPEVPLWGKYLVYATVLGCAETLQKQMKVKIDEMNVTDTVAYDPLFWNRMYLYNSISHSVSQGVHSAVSSSRSSIASSSSSSGGGFGGGASFGGGSFGGGGGGGRF